MLVQWTVAVALLLLASSLRYRSYAPWVYSTQNQVVSHEQGHIDRGPCALQAVAVSNMTPPVCMALSCAPGASIFSRQQGSKHKWTHTQ